jgi:phosphoglycolate phosphatase-like HAD superfamily hydrolase
MTCEIIICDWNGTITKDRDERHILESIAVDLFKASIPHHPLRMIRILKAKRDLEALQERGQEVGFDYVREMFRVYNERIIKDAPVSLIHRSVDKYATRKQTLEKLDYRVLRPIREYHEAGKPTAILSAGYKYGIERVLAAAGYGHCFDFYKANLLKENGGRAIKFGLDIYKNKPQLLLELLKDRNLDGGKAAYLGDSEYDEGCFEIVGYPVVAFSAESEIKKRCAERYKAFVPNDERELANYLKQA